MVELEPGLVRLQVVANQLLTTFLHSRRGPRADPWRTQLTELHTLRGAAGGDSAMEASLTWPAVARGLAEAFRTLGERLPAPPRCAEAACRVSIGPPRLDKTRRHRRLARRLQAQWHGGLADHAVGFYLHGSLGTGDDIAYSDCDTYIVLRDATVTQAERLLALRRHILGHTWILRAFDPHQHHGYFVVTEADLRAYPDPFLPVASLRVAACIGGVSELFVARRDALEESSRGCRQLAESIAAQEQQDPRRWSGHAAKSFLSRLMLLPTLVLGSRGQYVYKRESFDLARPLFPEAEWAAIEWASHLRAVWPLNSAYLRIARRLAGGGRWGGYAAETIGRAGLDHVSALGLPDLEADRVRQAGMFARRCLELVGPLPPQEER